MPHNHINQVKITLIFVLFNRVLLSVTDVSLHCATRENNHNRFLHLTTLALTPSQKHTPVTQAYMYTHLLHEAQTKAAVQPHKAHFVQGFEKELQL